ncbi:hypothetical protein MAE02_41530 [Microvirga aerophila]|uniref:Uncharacterized protein n=2 Tax=Microvirga aerophila TaxID=670291 RepID=A0A512BX79_9HYPH|nr:hypothetical protein MAE02_41530 [Microvirga aerophila]
MHWTVKGVFMMSENTWTFEAGDRVPEWLMRQTNCVLRFDCDAVVVESNNEYQIYPASAINDDDTMVLAEIIDQQFDAEVEHVLPIRTHTAPRSMSLN